MSEPNFDAWREVVNGPDTYTAIANEIYNRRAAIAGWTDGEGSHHDVLFTMTPRQFGNLQGGLRGPSDLFISIMRYGCFGFDVLALAPKHESYIAEKLSLPHSNSTITALTELINGVLAALHPQPLIAQTEPS
jgi:hypothetical protein